MWTSDSQVRTGTRVSATELQASQLGHCKLFGSTAGKLQAPGTVHSRGALVARTACSADREPVSQIQALASWKPPAQVPHHSTNEKPGPKNQKVPQKPSDPEIRKPKPRNPEPIQAQGQGNEPFQPGTTIWTPGPSNMWRSCAAASFRPKWLPAEVCEFNNERVGTARPPLL